mmetsp:Transcript_64026/g.130077  ORF Transcript_64026/g.130077 Transcript_64026/m.130077 type:complete len:92 (-) Transcript_64026:174-449(-)
MTALPSSRFAQTRSAFAFPALFTWPVKEHMVVASVIRTSFHRINTGHKAMTCTDGRSNSSISSSSNSSSSRLLPRRKVQGLLAANIQNAQV